MALVDGNTPVETLLIGIHLERSEANNIIANVLTAFLLQNFKKKITSQLKEISLK